MQRMARMGTVITAVALLAVLLVQWVGSQPVEGFGSYLGAFNDRYPAVVGSALDDCSVCHEVPGGPRNSYGQVVEAELDVGKGVDDALAAVESDDSDGDGASNIDEITALTHPGDPADSPAVATPAPAATPTPAATPAATPAPPAEANLSDAAVQVATVLAAIDIVDSSGFHGLAEDSAAATEINPRWAGTVNKALQTVGAAAWPSAVAAEVAVVKTDLEAAATALAAEDLAGAASALDALHGSQHGLSNAVYDWLSQETGKLASTPPAATPTPGGLPISGGLPGGGDGGATMLFLLGVFGGAAALAGVAFLSLRLLNRRA